MATTTPRPSLSSGNLIYLYDLLKREIGCGKQTFITAVEQALETDRMTAADLGFADTRSLLEALAPFVKLTVFKGGRVYATIMAQPEWDEALAAAPAGKVAKGGDKPWKRKKANKALKPVRPKRVKRVEPIAAPAEATGASKTADAEAAPVDETQDRVNATADIPKAQTTPAPATEMNGEPACAPKPTITNDDVFDDAGTDAAAETSAPGPAVVEPRDEHPVSEPMPEPAITLTVTYDPYSGIDEETTLESNPCAPVANPIAPPATTATDEPRAAVSTGTAEQTRRTSATAPESARAAAPVAAPEAAPSTRSTAAPELGAATPATPCVRAMPTPEVLATYPQDVATEVYLAHERIGELCELLPYGTDVFALLAEDWKRAIALELVRGTRARITFPLRIAHANDVTPIEITLKKRSGGALKWELAGVQ